MLETTQPILRTDAAGMPLEWVDYRRAATLQYLGQVAYTCGDHSFVIRGGINRFTHTRSVIEINSIIATAGTSKSRYRYSPPLHNVPLFQRDGYLCMYCGEKHNKRNLSRDHVTPLSHGGEDNWSNVVAACIRCNNFKAGRTPEQAGMQLLAIPFAPTHAEYIFLQGRRILADQMEFLKAHFPRTSPLHHRV
ncbi:MAG: HNH endonuclease [Pseudomonadota bacterium]